MTQNRTRLLIGVASTAAVLTLASCVELCGQRIAWRYDEPTDVLKVLIFYDGIHDTEVDTREGEKNFEEFVRDGDVMLVDWLGHIRMGELRRGGLEPDASERDKQTAALLASVVVQNLGYYLEPDGRIGAAQLVTISSARHFFKGVSDLLNAEVLDGPPSEGEFPRTATAMKDAARRGHEWFSLDGQAFRVRVPIDAVEWAALKGRFLETLRGEVVEEKGEGFDETPGRWARLLFQLAGSAPVSYLESGNEAVFTIGRTDATSVVRAGIRDRYSPNFEGEVVRRVGGDLNHELAMDAIGLNDAEPRPALPLITEWGPPEALPGALIAFLAADPEDATRAIDLLNLWAAKWNETGRIPAAPQGATAENPGAALDAWRAWYESMKRFPTP